MNAVSGNLQSESVGELLALKMVNGATWLVQLYTHVLGQRPSPDGRPLWSSCLSDRMWM